MRYSPDGAHEEVGVGHVGRVEVARRSRRSSIAAARRGPSRTSAAIARIAVGELGPAAVVEREGERHPAVAAR